MITIQHGATEKDGHSETLAADIALDGRNVAHLVITLGKHYAHIETVIGDHNEVRSSVGWQPKSGKLIE